MPLRKHLATSKGFWLSQLGARMLLGISQGCCNTVYNTQGKPHPTQRITQPKTSTGLSLTNSGLHWWHKYSKERFNCIQHISYKTNLWQGCFLYYALFVAAQGTASFLELKIIPARRKCKIIDFYIHQAGWFIQWDKDEPLLNTCHASGIHSTSHTGFHLNLTATCKSYEHPQMVRRIEKSVQGKQRNQNLSQIWLLTPGVILEKTHLSYSLIILNLFITL